MSSTIACDTRRRRSQSQKRDATRCTCTYGGRKNGEGSRSGTRTLRARKGGALTQTADRGRSRCDPPIRGLKQSRERVQRRSSLLSVFLESGSDQKSCAFTTRCGAISARGTFSPVAAPAARNRFVADPQQLGVVELRLIRISGELRSLRCAVEPIEAVGTARSDASYSTSACRGWWSSSRRSPKARAPAGYTRASPDFCRSNLPESTAARISLGLRRFGPAQVNHAFAVCRCISTCLAQ